MKLKQQHTVFFAFFIYALALGSLFSRIGEVQSALGISKGTLGLALVGIPAGAQISLMFGSRIAERLGFKFFAVLAPGVIALAQTLATASPSAVGFFAALFVAGLVIGANEIVINLEADRTEALLGRRFMNRAHAFWSFGFFAAGFLGAGLAGAGLSPTLHLAVVTVGVSVASFTVLRHHVPAPARKQDDATSPIFARPTAAILLLVVLTLPAMLMEGASFDWSVIYMRDIFDATPFVGAAALATAAFSQSMARFFADGVVDRFGPTAVARGMLILLGAGVLLVSSASFPAMAFLGFVLIGLGNSGLFPLAMSAAAQRTDRPAAVNVAALAQFSFIIFLAAPPILGAIAEVISIRASFGLGLPLVVAGWLAVKSLRPAES